MTYVIGRIVVGRSACSGEWLGFPNDVVLNLSLATEFETRSMAEAYLSGEWRRRGFRVWKRVSAVELEASFVVEGGLWGASLAG